jgi:hypothetical protein
MEWITIEQAKEKYGKSETTIRAISRRLKGSNSKSIRIEKSDKGKERILLDVNYLNIHFNVSTERKQNIVPDESNLIKMMSILEKQLDEKDKQIESLLQGQNELRFLLAKENEVKQLDNVKTKRKWYKLWLG